MARRKQYRDILELNRRTALEYATKVGKRELLQVLERASVDLQRRLTHAEKLKTGKADGIPFTEERLRSALRQIADVTDTVKAGVKKTILETGKTAAEASVESTIDYMAEADSLFRGISTPLALREAAVLDRAYAGTEASILHRLESDPYGRGRQGILERYGDATIQHFEEVMRLGLVTGENWNVMRNQLIAESPFLQQAPAYWAERLVRTELMASTNRAGWEGMRAIDDQLGDVYRVLVATMDDRTAWDSYQVHGQIRGTDEPFEWHSERGPVLYMHPPNRPNDRECVVPQRLSWELPPELEPVDDDVVAEAWEKERRKGSPPARPKMETIERSRFGK
jgi:hypothetical protein